MEEARADRVSPTARLVGTILVCINVALALLFASWTFWNRNAAVVKMMQPQFLLLLCFGIIIYTLSIIPLGANETTHQNLDAVCMSIPWLNHIGQAVTFAALFSKLWRVNKLFRAKGFHRKVVTVKDVLWPFAILMILNVSLLIAMNVAGPFVWKVVSKPDDGGKRTAVGHCQHENEAGVIIEGILDAMNGIALVILCVQAYRARDIGTEFSEARGVALALFCWLQSALIVVVPLHLMDPYGDSNSWYFLVVMPLFFNGLSMMLFIFVPIMSHHKRKVRGEDTEQNIHVTGLDLNPTTTAGHLEPPRAESAWTDDHNHNGKPSVA